MAEGVTTLEIKSGSGLSQDHEARCLRVARRLGRELPLTVRSTCLSAHALPPEFAGRAADYIDAVCHWLPALHAEGLVDAVDAFCEGIAFTPAQTRRGVHARTVSGRAQIEGVLRVVHASGADQNVFAAATRHDVQRLIDGSR